MIPAEKAPDLDGGTLGPAHLEYPFRMPLCFARRRYRQVDRKSGKRQFIIELMYEIIEGARSCGYDLAHDFPAKLKLIRITAALPGYQPSIYLLHARHRPMELDAIFATPLETVQVAGGAMPRIEAFYRALRFIDAHNVVAAHDLSSLE